MIKKEIIAAKSLSPFYICYNSLESKQTDTAPAIYETYKISLLLTDGLSAVTGDKIFDIKKGDIVFFHPDEVHFARLKRDGIHEYCDIYIPLGFFDSFEEKNELTFFFDDMSDSSINHISPPPNQREQIIKIAYDIKKLCTSQQKISGTYALSLMLDTVLICCELYEQQKNFPVNCNISPYVSKVLSYISENYQNDISTKLLSSVAGCSVTYLEKVFKESLGITIYRYLTNYRIEVAKKLLMSDLSVTEVCYRTGFGDCSNFISTFKRLTAYTPHQYKKKL